MQKIARKYNIACQMQKENLVKMQTYKAMSKTCFDNWQESEQELEKGF